MAELDKSLTPTDIAPAGAQILVIVHSRGLFDSLVLILSRRINPAKVAHAADLAEILTQLTTRPDLILADPFLLRSAVHSDDAGRLHWPGDAVPWVAILTEDSRDYRDAALEMGANGMIVLDQADRELLPVVERLLGRIETVNGVAGRISRLAKESAPAGEAAYPDFFETKDLEALSQRVIEHRLAAISPPGSSKIQPTPGTNPPAGENERAYIRGLTRPISAPVGAPADRVARTACNLNCGSHFCGLRVTVRDEKITRIEPADFPDPRYRRICLKGISHLQITAHPDRLLYPLKRSGERGAGVWERISWEQALDEIAGKMQRVAQSYGWKSMMFFPYSGQLSALNGFTGVYSRLASLLGASGTSASAFGLDSAVPGGIEYTFGEGAGYLANDYSDLPNSRLVLIWGGDPVQSRMNWWRFFQDARAGGTRLITIDPRFTITAAKSDAWLPVRPGSDLYLALALLHEIVSAGWIDRDFVLQKTVAPLLVREDTGRFLRAADLDPRAEGDSFLVWDVSQERAVPESEQGTPALESRFCVGKINCRTAYDLLREMLTPYTAEFAASKTGLQAGQIRSLAHQYATTKPARIFSLYGIDRWSHGVTFGRLIATLAALTGNLGVPGGGAGVDGLSDWALFSSSFPTPEGRQHPVINPAVLAEQIVSGKPYPVKGIFVAFSNWLNQWPDQNFLLGKALPGLDLLVVAEQFMTETARWADYVLPAATLFEREDMVKGPGPYVQYQPKILPPPGECRSDFDIAAALAARLGVGSYFSHPPSVYLAQIFAEQEAFRGVPFEELRTSGVLTCRSTGTPGVVHRYPYPTRTRRVEFYVEDLLPYGRALPGFEAPVEAGAEGPLASRYPLVCITFHNRYRVHTSFSWAPWLREFESEPFAYIHPSAAQERHIQNGDLVRVFNDRGFVVLRCAFSQAIPPEAIYMSQGWQSKDYVAGHAQTLTHSRFCSVNVFGPNSSLSDVRVEVEKAS